jgi:predicted amino acid racemase
VVSEYRPEVITVFTAAKAEQIDRAARRQGVTQDVLSRVHSRTDTLFAGMEGGFYMDELPAAIDQIIRLKNICRVGVTSFPVIRYDTPGGVRWQRAT